MDHAPIRIPTLAATRREAVTPEGHALRFNAEGDLVGTTLVRPKHLRDQSAGLRITLPIPSDGLAS